MKTKHALHNFIAGKTLHTCNKFELEHFDVEILDLDALLLVHDGTKPVGTFPDVYRRAGDALKLVEWWT